MTPREKTKNSLTGGALLPKPTASNPNPQNPNPPAETSETTTSASTPPAKPLFIRGENDETPQADVAHGNPVETAETSGTTGNTANTVSTTVPEIPEWLLKKYEEIRKKCAGVHFAPETPKAVTSDVANPCEGMPRPGTQEFLLWKYEQSRKNCAEMLGHPLETPEPQSIASGLADLMADIREKRERTAPAEESGNPVVQPEAMNESADPAAADKTPARKNMGKKKSAKSKSTYDGSPKDIYSLDYVPEVMRPTAELFLLKTGRRGFRWEEISVLRRLSATHYPTVVSKEILVRVRGLRSVISL